MDNDSAPAKIVIGPGVLARAGARDAEINGKPPRIAPVAAEDYTDEARAITAEMAKAAGLPPDSKLPEFIATMLRHPRLYRPHAALSLMLMGGGALPARARELAVLRVAWMTQAPYEWNAHVDMGKRVAGLAGEEIERIIIGSAAPGWSARDAAVLAGVEEMLSDAMISDATWAVLAEHYDECQLMELPILVGQYLGIAYLQNTIRARLMPHYVGLSAR